jgi:hypothetical protein
MITKLDNFTPESLDRMTEAATIAGRSLGDFIDAVERFRSKLEDVQDANILNGDSDGY